MRHPYTSCKPTNKKTKNKTYSNNEHVHNCLLFQLYTISNIHKDIKAYNSINQTLITIQKVSKYNKTNRDYPTDNHNDISPKLTYSSTCYWTFTFLWMFTISFYIINIIKTIDTTGSKTE